MPFLIQGALFFLVQQVTLGAQEALTGVLNLLVQPTTVSLDGQNNWFVQQFSLIRTMAVWVMLPLIVIAIIHAIAKGSLNQLFKSAVVYPLVAFFGTMVAIRFTALLVGISDDFSSLFINTVSADIGPFFDGVSSGLTVDQDQIGRQLLVMILAILLMFASLITFVMLVVRDASIYLATAFLPIGFAMLVWPTTMKHFKRMVEFLIGMIFSKVVMCAVIAIGVSSLAAAGGVADPASLNPTGTAMAGAAGGSDDMSWLTTGMVAVVMLFMTGAAPGASVKMVGGLGFDGDVGHALGLALTRPAINKQFMGIRRQIANVQLFGEVNRRQGELIRTTRNSRGASAVDAMLAEDGIRRNAAGNYHLGTRDLNSVTDAYDANLIRDLSRSDNANDVRFAHKLLEAYQTGGTVTHNGVVGAGGRRGDQIHVVRDYPDGSARQYVQSQVLIDVVNARGRPIDRLNVRAASNQVRAAAAQQDAIIAGSLGRINPNAQNSAHITVNTGRIASQATDTVAITNQARGWQRRDRAAGTGARRYTVTGARPARPAFNVPGGLVDNV